MSTISPNNLANLLIMAVGSVANTALLITLIKRPPTSLLTRILTQWQFIADGMTCLVGFCITLTNVLTTPASFITDSVSWAVFTCYLWRNNALAMSFAYFATNNLICLGMDRFWAVCRPVTYKQHHVRCLVLCFVFDCAGIVELLGTLLPNYVLINGTVCLNAPNQITLRVSPTLWFAVNWVLICSALCIIYLRVAYEMWKRTRQINIAAMVSGQHREMMTLTVAMVTMSALSCILFSWSRVGLFLNSFGLAADFVLGSPKQQLGITLIWAYSALAPIAYIIAIPRYHRKAVQIIMKILHCGKETNAGTSQVTATFTHGHSNNNK